MGCALKKWEMRTQEKSILSDNLYSVIICSVDFGLCSQIRSCMFLMPYMLCFEIDSVGIFASRRPIGNLYSTSCVSVWRKVCLRRNLHTSMDTCMGGGKPPVSQGSHMSPRRNVVGSLVGISVFSISTHSGLSVLWNQCLSWSNLVAHK